MLQNIREMTQGWIATVIISLIIISFALWGVHSYFQGGVSNNNVVAYVNDSEITKQQLSGAYDRLKRQITAQYGNAALFNNERIIKEQALQSLIELEALKQNSISQGYRVTDIQIDEYLQRMPEFEVNGQFSLQKFKQLLNANNISPGEFLNLIRLNLLIDQPKIGLMYSAFSLPQETKQIIDLVHQERNVQFLKVPLNILPTQAILVTSDQIAKYYQANQKEFMNPEQVSIEYLELNINDLMTSFSVSDETLIKYFNENKSAFTLPTQWKFSVVSIPVAANATQAQVAIAEKKAQTIVSALKQGAHSTVAKDQTVQIKNTDWTAINQLPSGLQNQDKLLEKKGNVSEPIRANGSLVIYEVLDKRAPQEANYDQVKDKVKAQYTRQQAEEKLAELREKLADSTYEHPESLTSASEALNLPIKTSGLFSRAASTKDVKDVSQYKNVREAAFSNEVMNLQNNSDVIQLTPESYIVLRVKSHIPEKTLPLAQVSDQIQKQLKSQFAEDHAKKTAETIRQQLASGINPQKVAEANRIKWETTGFVGRYATNVDNAILDLAFKLPESNKQKPIYSVARLKDGFAIVHLEAVKPGKLEGAEQNTIFAEQVQNSLGVIEYEFYKRSLVNEASVKIQ